MISKMEHRSHNAFLPKSYSRPDLKRMATQSRTTDGRRKENQMTLETVHAGSGQNKYPNPAKPATQEENSEQGMFFTEKLLRCAEKQMSIKTILPQYANPRHLKHHLQIIPLPTATVFFKTK